MIGDAAYCPTPLTGMGTTLAMVGAYLLAGELSCHDKYEDAFIAYEKRMRPFVEKVQKLPLGVPWLADPKSKFGVSVVNMVASMIASRPFKMISRWFSSKKKNVPKMRLNFLYLNRIHKIFHKDIVSKIDD